MRRQFLQTGPASESLTTMRPDTYMTAAQIRDWKQRLGVSVPVSVNVSRIDMFDPDLAETLTDILKSQDLDGKNFLLERFNFPMLNAVNLCVVRIKSVYKLSVERSEQILIFRQRAVFLFIFAP